MAHYELLEMANGMRIARLPYNSAVSYAGIILNVGSAHETEDEFGIAHFIEHLLFKGTPKRSTHAIINHLEKVGGELNAFTTKEETTIYAAFPSIYYRRAIDLLCDITFRSNFPEKQVKTERNVVLDEITSYKDTPSENIFDEFDEIVMKGHPLAHNILGTDQSLENITTDQIKTFHQDQYFQGNPVFFYMGDLPIQKIEQLLTKHLEGLQFGKKTSKKIVYDYSPAHEEIMEDTYQAHYIAGITAPGFRDPNKIPLVMLTNMIGGPSMNSILNMNLREKNGIAYNVEASYAAYEQMGVISIYYGTDERKLNKSNKIVHAQLKKLRDQKLTTARLEQYKTQFYGQVAISRENSENVFLNFGKNILRHNYFSTLEEVHKVIERVDADLILELANQYYNPQLFSTLTIR